MTESNADLSLGSLDCIETVSEDVLGQNEVLEANRIHVAEVISLCNDPELDSGDASK